ncbi:MAG: endonuclease III domain-containing protein [Planctomycetaceae bacterium]|nr:MAG: endonuclease III domain-containing protein [Planctomycetaceae bacterium]
MSKTSQLLMDMYNAMLEHFGHQAWWPGQTPLEICVGAILTQNTNWTNVEKALANLAAADSMSISAINAMPPEKLADLIRPAGYLNVKAKRLKNFVRHVHDGWGDDLGKFLNRSVGTLREELLGINGIGRETADSIILYAAGKPTFVVDTYTCRIMFRHHVISPEDDYEAVKELMESHLPTDTALWNDYHAQIVAVGKKFCKPTAQCEGCPLEQFPHDRLAGQQ